MHQRHNQIVNETGRTNVPVEFHSLDSTPVKKPDLKKTPSQITSTYCVGNGHRLNPRTSMTLCHIMKTKQKQNKTKPERNQIMLESLPFKDKNSTERLPLKT